MRREGAWLTVKFGRRETRLDLWLLPILLLAALVRFNGLDWGWSDFDPAAPQGKGKRFYTFHPDEASNLRVARNFEQSESWRPTGDLYGQKVDYSLYGASTVYLQVMAVKLGSLFSGIEPYDEEDQHSMRMSYLSVRWMTALLGLFCILLLYAATIRLYDAPTARLAALFLAFAAFHAQSGRFGTVDIPMVFFSLWSFAHAVRLLKEDSWTHRLLAALAAGLAVSTKINAVLVVAPLVAAELLRAEWPSDWKAGLKLLPGRLFSPGLLAAGAVTIGVFFLLNPYAFIDWRNYLFADHAFALVHILKNVRGEFFYPFQIQFQEIKPFFFLLGNVLFWAAGPALELLGLAGLPWLAWKRRKADLVVLAWVLPAFLLTAGAQVMFMRYSLPFLPLLALMAAVLCADLLASRHRVTRPLGLALTGSALLLSFGWSWALASVHCEEDSRIRAGRYLYEAVPEGSSLLHERSANTIKLTIDMARYENVCMEIPTVYRADANGESEKIDFLAGRLRQVEWAAILESNRKLGYERTSRYPAERAFYGALFAEELGFVRDTVFQTLPSFAGISVDDQAAEFSLRYYDHEEIHIFRLQDLQALEAGVSRIKARLAADPATVDFQLARIRKMLDGGRSEQARDLASTLLQQNRGQAPVLQLMAGQFSTAAQEERAAGRQERAVQLVRQADELYSQAVSLPQAGLGRELRMAEWLQFRLEAIGPEAARELLYEVRRARLDSPELRAVEAMIEQQERSGP